MSVFFGTGEIVNGPVCFESSESKKRMYLCSNCTTWQTDPKDRTLMLCNSCYQKVQQQQLEEFELKCSICQRTSHRWYSHPNDPTLTLRRCVYCAQAAWKLASMSRKNGHTEEKL